MVLIGTEHEISIHELRVFRGTRHIKVALRLIRNHRNNRSFGIWRIARGMDIHTISVIPAVTDLEVYSVLIHASLVHPL